MRALGIYREPEFSPGKVEADAAILDAVLSRLKSEGFGTAAIEARRFADPANHLERPDVILAMCQGGLSLSRLAALEESGAMVINSALSIRNCYRDLLSSGLLYASVPIPPGLLLETATA